jgi:hypothetical protein
MTVYNSIVYEGISKNIKGFLHLKNAKRSGLQ